MTETEQKARDLLNKVSREHGLESWYDYTEEDTRETHIEVDALCRAIERHEAFRQKVSDAVVLANARVNELKRNTSYIVNHMQQYIIAKPDPLVEAWKAQYPDDPLPEASCANLRAAIEKRGGKIVWGEG